MDGTNTILEDLLGDEGADQVNLEQVLQPGSASITWAFRVAGRLKATGEVCLPQGQEAL